MRQFTLSDKYSVVCESSDTRNGFKHTATLLTNGLDTGETVKCNYLNRTWESYDYQSVLYKLIQKSKWLDDEEKKVYTNKVREGAF